MTEVASPERPSRPKRVERGIEAVWSLRLEAWCWRARRAFTMEGVRVVRVGRLRRSQSLAADDYATMDGSTRARRGLSGTLAEAIEAAIAAARDRDVARDTAKAYRSHGKYLLRYWKPETRLEWLTVEELRWFVREAREDGASPNTIRGKYLALLAQCFEIAELPNPVPDTLRELKGTLKHVPPRLEFLTVAEIRCLIDRMRHETFLDGAGRTLDLPAREHHADVVALFAGTGVRVLELSRVRLEDVDLARGEIHVRKPKDAANPRRLFVGATLRPAVERIVARAERERSAGRNIDGRLLPNLRFAAINIFRRWGERLGEPRLTGRTLRHSYVTAVLLLGGSAYDARVLAGHRNLKTTDRYVGELEGRRPIVDVIDAALAGSHAQGTEAVAP